MDPDNKQEHDEVMRAIGQVPEYGGCEHDEIMEIITGNNPDYPM